MAEYFVEIFSGDILSADSEREDYSQFLNAEDKQKAAGFLRPELAKKYIKTRGVLRKILAEYLNEKAEKLVIKTNEYGKPFVPEVGLFFNLSHSGNQFVIAVSNVCELGVDLEQPRQRGNLASLVDKCFSSEEKTFWENLPVNEQAKMFYDFWVRKEAFVKAVGRGIALGLNQCVVNPDQQNTFLRIPEAYGNACEWRIINVSIAQAYCCALVTKQIDFECRQVRIE